MLIRNNGSRESQIASSEITPKETFFSRRNFVRGAAALGVGALALRQVPGLFHPDAVHGRPEVNDCPQQVHGE